MILVAFINKGHCYSIDMFIAQLYIRTNGGSSAGAPGERPLFENFENIDSITCINFIVSTCNVYSMYFILYSHYKSMGYVWRGIKTISRHQILYRAGTAPPVLKFLDPPLRTTLLQRGIPILNILWVKVLVITKKVP